VKQDWRLPDDPTLRARLRKARVPATPKPSQASVILGAQEQILDKRADALIV